MAEERVTSLRVGTTSIAPVRTRLQVIPSESERTLTVVPTLRVRALHPLYRIAKRCLDILVSASALIVLAPLLALLILLVRATSTGPAFFRQERVGEGGRVFTIYKFRSMYSGADATLHELAYEQFIQGKGGNGKVVRETLTLAELAGEIPSSFPPLPLPLASEVQVGLRARPQAWMRQVASRVHARLHPDDPRITAVGAVLRATSLDELPQLINVLRGDMSLVGPRPPIPYELRHYKPRHFERLTVQPGLTGIWQVYGRNRVPFDQMVEMDITYIESRSFWLDVKLIALTVPAVLRSREAQ